MLVKIVSFFLIFMVVLAMFGRLKMPGMNRIATQKCQRCGRYKLGKGPCNCGGRA